MITAGTDTLVWTRVDDSTVSLQLPELESQTLRFTFHSSRYTGPVGTVEVAGYGGTSALSQDFYGPIIPWPWRNPSAFLGANDLSSNFARPAALADPATGHVTVYPSLLPGPYPGWLSYETGILLAQDSAAIDRWVLSSLTRAGSVPLSTTRQLYELSPNAFLVTSSHYAWTSMRPDSSQPFVQQYFEANESTWKIVFSPRGDRATIITNANYAGIPVFDLTTADSAFHVTALQTSFAAEFSPDGSVLYMAGTTLTGGAGAYVLVAVDATDGTLLHQITLDHDPAGIVSDPAGKHLYLATSDTVPRLQVYDPATLALQATLRVPASAVQFNPLDPWCPMVIAAPQRLLYLLPDENPATRVLRFDLLD